MKRTDDPKDGPVRRGGSARQAQIGLGGQQLGDSVELVGENGKAAVSKRPINHPPGIFCPVVFWGAADERR
jgi:hypothetical protein